MPTNSIAASGRRAFKRQAKQGVLPEDDEDTTVASAVKKMASAVTPANIADKGTPASKKTVKTPATTKTSSKKAAVPAAGAKRSRKQAQVSYEEEEESEMDENEFGGDDVQFDDISDEDAYAEDYGDDDSVQDDDDFETKARKYKKALMKEGRIADAEAQDERGRQAKITPLADADAGDDEGDRAEILGLKPSQNIEDLKARIAETVRVLTSFKDQREDGRTRDEYLALLKQDLIELHEYNDFLMDRILEIFPPHEAVEFLDAMEKERPLTLRTNTLKAKRRDLVQNLTKRGMSIEPLEKWSKVGLQVFDYKVQVGATLEYLAGHYMVQAAASFLPVMALAPQEGEKILDMAAAPGGKTTYICQLMKNTGIVVANDPSEARCKSLNANIQRLGITNCIVTNYDGVGYQRVMRHFDRILLDAPCTGTGVISRDKSIKTSKQQEDVNRVSLLQRRLLLEAIDCCKPGGVVVYSTCSFLVEEDEAVVDFALHRRYVEIVDMGLPFGRPGFTKFRHHRFDASLENSRRYFPHVHNMDGFYVCKLRKIQDGVIGEGEQRPLQQNGNANNNAQGKGNAMSKEEQQAAARTQKKQRQAAAKELKRKERKEAAAAAFDPRVSRPPPSKPAVKPQTKKDKKRKGGDPIPNAAPFHMTTTTTTMPTPAPTPAPAAKTKPTETAAPPKKKARVEAKGKKVSKK